MCPNKFCWVRGDKWVSESGYGCDIDRDGKGNTQEGRGNTGYIVPRQAIREREKRATIGIQEELLFPKAGKEGRKYKVSEVATDKVVGNPSPWG